ncbi:translation initiation factor 1 (eIF-1/SUI1) [Mariprofundus ferrinatatus]|uniref:Translation initiation factor 1 (eIF-1/SUI1) n=1 Tax=Mariprofundus ferrinatatus TaxID=1921087 RepID=A0A2K8L495_9PROT|nr:translation initiation factor [Mariprofundus ferrinatatus]ATX81059.1 translation initiation factor 1 (eIF-1/SUI1) [Mariprofundus ferrinatatus]
MNSDRRLVYSTENGPLDKPMRGKKSGRKKMSPQSSSPAITSPGKQGVRIRRESKGRGGKTVSIIDGLALDGSELKVLLKKLKAQLGTGGAVKNGSLEIQGEHREKLMQLLEQEGVKAKLSGG